MAIDKITPHRLDKTSDFKLVPETSMVDALNMLISEDVAFGGSVNDSSEGGGGGDLGVLKNVKGNSLVQFVLEDLSDSGNLIFQGNAKIIGSVTDTKLKILYFFVWHELPGQHGVYAYDPMGKLPGGGDYTHRIRRIHKSNLYNFPQHGFVKADIIYTSQSRLNQDPGGPIKQGSEKDFEKDAILYFTDNTNEPRKLNVYMALMDEDGGYQGADKIDFITACPKVPLTPIVFNFVADLTRTGSHFQAGPGFQFAYQFVSKDGVESAISPYSDIAFSPGIIQQGTFTNVDGSLHNKCQLQIPEAGKEIESVKILARQFNNPEMVILDDVLVLESKENWDHESRVYSFYNDRVVKGVSQNEVNKQYDNLPKKAQAQALVDNRLMYGNFLEGFDNIKTQCSSTVTFMNRGQEGADHVLKIVPAISEQPNAHNIEFNFDAGDLDATNKSAGYILDASDLPHNVDAGTTINVTLSIAPNQNFHIYQAQDSYHQSRHKGAVDPDTESDINYDVPLVEEYTGSVGGFYGGGPLGQPASGSSITEPYGHQDLQASGADWISSHSNSGGAMVGDYDNFGGPDNYHWGIPFAGKNAGVGGTGAENNLGINFSSPIWRTEFGESAGESRDVRYGTSAANPLIFKGGQLYFNCSFTMGAVGGSAHKAIISILSSLLSGETPTWGGGEESGFLTIHNVQNNFSYDIDLQLNESFQKFDEGHPVTKLITTVMEKPDGFAYDVWDTPVGYFVVNRAKLTFSLEKDEHYGVLRGGNNQMLRLVLDKVEPKSGDDEVDLVTMVKKMWPGQPWHALRKEYFTEGDFSAFYSDGSSELHTAPLLGPEWHPPCKNNIDDFSYDYNSAYVEILIEQQAAGFPDGEYAQPKLSGTFDFDYMLGSYSTGLWTSATQGPAINGYNKLKQQLFFGYLDFQQNGVVDNFFRYNRQNYNEQVYQNNPETFPFSLLDGEGGPGGKLPGVVGSFPANKFGWDGDNPPSNFILMNAQNVIESNSNYWNEGEVAVIEANAIFPKPGNGFSSAPRVIAMRQYVIDPAFVGDGVDSGQRVYRTYIDTGGPCFTGSITNSTSVSELGPNQNMPFSYIGGQNLGRSFLPLVQGAHDDISDGGIGFLYMADSAEHIYSNSGGFLGFEIDFFNKHSHVEILNLGFLIGPSTGYFEGIADRTFKSNANHDFGIVYYDERGRHGFVNHLKTVYVPGYSQQERGGPQHGRSEITLNIEHPAPKWAHYYKLAYTKNTSVENFVQYTAGGAYLESHVAEGAESELATGENTNIYVSLNYLQESPISYVTDWGARDPEGGLNMFKHIPGRNQKLRVISAYDYGNNKLYYFNYEFEIVDFVLLGEEENALTTYTPDKPWKRGAFVVVKNNPNAIGFDYDTLRDMQSGYQDPNLWANNCIVELYTPARDQERFYYEIGDTYDIDQPGTDAAVHSQSNITLTRGDVWWRKVPINWREYASGQESLGDTFLNLIKYTDDATEANPSASNFKPYYIETETASDLFKADATLIGRPNIISEEAVESIREAGITYSQKSNPNSKKINYSSFNLTLLNFKDLQEEFGDINYMCNMEGDVFVIQSDRCTLVPASKTLFSDVSGIDTVAASKSPLGQERIYAGRAGCDNNPESAVQVGSFVYFAHKNLGKVFRFNPSNGVMEISDQGMASYFRTLFQEAIASSQDINYNDIRVVGGFDPVQEEYLLTVLYNTTYEDGLPGPVEDISYGDDVVIDPFTDIEELPEEQAQQINEVFLGRIPEGVDLDISGNIGYWYESLDGSFYDMMDFGFVERTPSGNTVTRDLYISNMGSEDVFVKIRPRQYLKFYANDQYPEAPSTKGHYRNPSFSSIKNEAGITQVGQFSLQPVKTLIPAGTYHTFTMTINVNEAEHPYSDQQYLIDTFGTTKRALTGSERALGGENLPNITLAGSPYYDSSQAGTIEFEVYNMDDNLLLGVDDAGSFPYRRKKWKYQIMDALEGDQLPGTPDVVTGVADIEYADYSADVDGDGFVGTSDMLQLLGNFGQTGDNLLGDINNDGVVAVDDLLILLNQFGGDAPSIYDVMNVPPLNLNAFAEAIITAAGQSQYAGISDIDEDSLSTYYELVFLASEGLVSTVLFNQFPEVWNFVSGGGDFMNVLTQVYLTDDSGNYIPYGSAEAAGPPALDLCAWPVLQNPLLPDTVDISMLGDVAFFAGLPPYIGTYVNLDINQFIVAYLTDENGQPINISCNVGGGGG